MAVHSRAMTNARAFSWKVEGAIGGLSYASENIISLLKLGDMAISRFLSLENRVALLDPLHCCCGFEVNLLGLESACGAIDNDTSETYKLWLEG